MLNKFTLTVTNALIFLRVLFFFFFLIVTNRLPSFPPSPSISYVYFMFRTVHSLLDKALNIKPIFFGVATPCVLLYPFYIPISILFVRVHKNAK
jgi:hypothetical protein